MNKIALNEPSRKYSNKMLNGVEWPTKTMTGRRRKKKRMKALSSTWANAT